MPLTRPVRSSCPEQQQRDRAGAALLSFTSRVPVTLVVEAFAMSMSPPPGGGRSYSLWRGSHVVRVSDLQRPPSGSVEVLEAGEDALGRGHSWELGCSPIRFALGHQSQRERVPLNLPCGELHITRAEDAQIAQSGRVASRAARRADERLQFRLEPGRVAAQGGRSSVRCGRSL